MKVLIVWYSRDGHTTKAAGALRDALVEAGNGPVDTVQLVEKASRAGMWGWLTGGRDASLKRKGAIQPVAADVASYDLVVIGTPVWAFTMTPAIRAFCADHAADLTRAAFLCTMGGSGDQRTFRDMAALTDHEPVGTLTLIDRDIDKASPSDFLEKVSEFAVRITADPDAVDSDS